MRRLESGYAAKRSWPKHRASRLFPDRERYHARGDCRGRPARTSPRRVLQVAGISRGPWSAIGEGSRYRLAEEDRPAAAHLANDGRVFGSHTPFVEWRTIFGRHPFRLYNILHSKWNSR